MFRDVINGDAIVRAKDIFLFLFFFFLFFLSFFSPSLYRIEISLQSR